MIPGVLVQSRSTRPLGGGRYVRGLEEAAARRRSGALPRQRAVPAREASIIVTCVSDLAGVTPVALTAARTAAAPGQDATICAARALCCQLLFERDHGVAAIARVVGRDQSTVRHSLRRLELHLSSHEWDELQRARRLVRLRLAAAEGGQGQ